MTSSSLAKASKKSVNMEKFFGKKTNGINLSEKSIKTTQKKSSVSSIKSFYNNFSEAFSGESFSSNKDKLDSKNLYSILSSININVIEINSILNKNYLFNKKTYVKKQRDDERKRYKEKESRLKTTEKKDNKIKRSKNILPSFSFIDTIKRFIFFTIFGAIYDKIVPLIPTLGKVASALAGVADFALELFGGITHVLTKFLAQGIRLVNGLTKSFAIISGAKTEEEISAFEKKFNTMIDLTILAAMLTGNSLSEIFDLFGKGKKQSKGGPLKGDSSRGGGVKKIATKIGGRKGARFVNKTTKEIKNFANKSTGNVFARGKTKSLTRLGAKVGGKKGASLVKGAGKNLGKFGGPIATVALAAWDFSDRKSSGQSNIQAGAGTAAGVGGALAGAKGGAALGAAIGSVVPGVGTLIGGALGGLIGAAGGAWAASKTADKITGANKIQGLYNGGLINKYQNGGLIRPSKTKPQETKPGKDVGGYYEITKLFPDPDLKGKSGQSESMSEGRNLWSFLNPFNWFSGPQEKTKSQGSSMMPNSLKSLRDTSETFKKIPFIGELMGLAVDISMGQKPEKMVYNQIAKNMVYLSQRLSTSKNISSITDIKTDIQKLEVGGIASEINKEFLSVKFTEKSVQEISNTIAIAIETGANDALTKIRKEILTSKFESSARQSQSNQHGHEHDQYPSSGADENTSSPLNDGRTTATGSDAKLLTFISKGEGGYNSMNQGTRGGRIVGSTHNASTILGKNLTDMTVEEVMSHQSAGRLFAAGRYQIIPSTMKLAVQRSGVSKSSKFDIQTQDKLGLALIYNGQRPRLSAYLQGKNNDLRGAMLDLALEWASVPHPDTGRSAYPPANRSSHSVEEVKQALISSRRGRQSQSAPSSSQASTSQRPISSSSSKGTPQRGFPTGYAPSTPGKFNAIEYITGERGHPNFELAGHGLPSNYHDHIAFKSSADKDSAKRALISSGIRIGSEYRPGDRGYHGVNLAIDIPGYQWGGSGSIGEREFKGSKRVRQVLGLDSFGGSDVKRRGIESRFHGGLVTKDSLVKVHAGEYVIDKDSVDIFGIDFFEAANKVENLVTLKNISPILFNRIDDVIKGSFGIIPEVKGVYTQSGIINSSKKTTKNLENFITSSERKTKESLMYEEEGSDISGIQVVPGNHPQTGSGFMINGVNDGNQRPLILAKGAITSFGKMMKDSKGAVKGSDVASGKRSEAHNRKVGGVPNSNHLGGNALDIHGSSQTWMRKQGKAYGWIINDYPGSHGGHFDYKGKNADDSGDSFAARSADIVNDSVTDGGGSSGGRGGGSFGGGGGGNYKPVDVEAEPTEPLVPGGKSRPTGSPGGGFSGQELDKMSNKQKWKSVMLMAEKAGAKYPELVAAQFALESGWGKSLAAKNNYFGIKATSNEDATVSNTREEVGGGSVYIDARFKNFKSPQDAINHLVTQWYKDYKGYKGVNNAKSAVEAAAMLKAQGYATDSGYMKHLQRLVSENEDVRITEQDKVAFNKKSKDEFVGDDKDKPRGGKDDLSKPGSGDPGDVEKDQQIAGSTKDSRYGRLGIPNTDGQDTGADIELFGKKGEIGKTFGDNSKEGPYGNRGVEISFPYELIYLEKVPGGRNKGHKSITTQGSTSRDYKPVTGATGFGNVGSYFYKDPKSGKMFEVMMGHGNKPFKKFKDGEKISPGTVVGWQGASGSSDSMQGGVYDHVTFHVNAVDGGDPGPIFDKFVNSLLKGDGAKVTSAKREEKKRQVEIAKKKEEERKKNPLIKENDTRNNLISGIKSTVSSIIGGTNKTVKQETSTKPKSRKGIKPSAKSNQNWIQSTASNVLGFFGVNKNPKVAKAEDGGQIGKAKISKRGINKFAGYENPSNQTSLILYQEKITYINKPDTKKSSNSISFPGSGYSIDNTYHLRRN